ncbi:CaiB/BaiF CoA transferase family protein [Actinomycetospora callitridis]|uniref:CaiB/BaiF CoA transferase family protein n=1 Tax=Actinomycetospora callitridis TaxID=913944 RepID=UPI0023665372|nr:CoA transferase [Actinomycetospora callitridis]MDD7916342.1 CoA transferase [Actinomycetospora callitridis]
MTAPLSGVRVVDLGQFIAAPVAGQALVEMGADVVKLEPVAGEGARHIGVYGDAMVRTHNGGKRAIAVDLRSADGRRLAQRLVERADIVLQNSRHGALDAAGLGPAAVRRANPTVVYGTVTGFGRSGPSAHRPGFDIAAQAESGIMWITGESGGPPQRVGFPVVDAAAGHVLAEAVLAAYIGRLRFGEGRHVEVSLLEVAIALQGTVWGEYFATGQPPSRKGNGQPTVAPAADLVDTADGPIVVSAYTPAHFARLCAVLERPDLAEDPRFATNADRVVHRDALLAELSVAFGAMPRRAALDLLVGHGLVAASIDSYEQVERNPDVLATGIFTEVSTAAGPHRVVGVPWRDGDGRPARARHAPALGEHTADVLAEIGCTPDEVDALAAAGVVHVPAATSLPSA